MALPLALRPEIRAVFKGNWNVWSAIPLVWMALLIPSMPPASGIRTCSSDVCRRHHGTRAHAVRTQTSSGSVLESAFSIGTTRMAMALSFPQDAGCARLGP